MLALASTVILSPESSGTHDHPSVTHDSGSSVTRAGVTNRLLSFDTTRTA
jgi:hypothetical protein